MSKLTDIQYRIDQLDGGAFQNLCDAYLTCKGYGIGYSLGMRTGTNKTAKGNPDTYFLKEDGKYVFVMYTTQKDDFVKKALQDLEKCFDANKTGIPAENVGEIVYCHTCGRLSAGDTQTLNEFCKARNSKLTLIGLDNLGADIYWHYPRIAKDFLEVSVDTGQIMSIQDFVQVHICLPTFLHEQYVLLAAGHKKHVICEKPVTLSLESLDRMIAATKAAGVQFAVGQVVRFWPEYVRAKEMVEAGELGTIKYARASRLSEHPAWSEWYRRAENSGGGLFDLHLHDIDYLCYLFGKVKQVYAVGRKNSVGCWNHVATSLTFENGMEATAEGILEMPSGFPFTTELNVVGDKKAYCYHMGAGANLENIAAASRSTTVYGDGKAETLAIDPYDAYQKELEDFIGHIEAGTPITVITPADVRHVLSVIVAIRESLETQKTVTVS